MMQDKAVKMLYMSMKVRCVCSERQTAAEQLRLAIEDPAIC
jgi:hypothetical protein